MVATTSKTVVRRADNSNAVRVQLEWVRRVMKAPRLRSMRGFSEEEVLIPNGPHEGERFRVDRQPYTGLYLDGVDSGRWQRFNATGPVQSGKTLTCVVIPTLYHLFEVGETVIFGLPNMDMARDKWHEDLLPVIERTRYRDLLPRTGSGSRGGTQAAIRFRDGQVLRFMTGGGGDKQRAGYTSRVVVISETDGMGGSAGGSVEADKITQIEARTRAYGSRRRLYMECTVTVGDGRTWLEYKGGTESRIVLPCPLCRAWVHPEREHLVGWRDAETVLDARDGASFSCPSCGGAWTDEQRLAANVRAVLVHRGQEVAPDGSVVGEPPRTDTLGFRWSGVNNMFCAAGDVAMDEWRAVRDPDEDNAEKKMCQQVWALPYRPQGLEASRLDADRVKRRRDSLPRGVVPGDAAFVAVGVDLGQRLGHWVALCWRKGRRGHIVDYGRFDIASDDLGAEPATLIALRDFADHCRGGWSWPGHDPMAPRQVWVDCRWYKSTNAVYAACRGLGGFMRPVMGYGSAQQRDRFYRRPSARRGVVRAIGRDYHVTRLAKERLDLVHINADYWKTWVHNGLRVATDKPGAVTLFGSPDKNVHLSFAKHLTAEHQAERFVPNKGAELVWVMDRRSNHWFDSSYIAAAAAHFCGARLAGEEPAPAPASTSQTPDKPFLTPDGRPFLVTER